MLLAGRTGQKYNRRKKGKGAFREDRYHVTAVEKGDHLLQCIVYIDMKMVRAGVVNGDNARNDKWTCSFATGSQQFIQNIKELMGGMVSGRKLSESGKSFQRQEAQTPYSALFDVKKDEMAPGNSYFW